MLKRSVHDRTLGPALAEHVVEYLATLAPGELTRALIGGVTCDELRDGRHPASRAAMLRPHDLVIDPLPNHLFTRDASCWIYGGVSLNPMATPVRRRETVHVEAICRFHPRFADAKFDVWFGGVDEDWDRSTLEGGDVLVLGNGVVLIGMGARTTPYAVELVARRLFAGRSRGRRFSRSSCPKARSYMHLDTVMTMVDRDTFLMYPGVVDGARTWSMRPGDALGRARRHSGSGAHARGYDARSASDAARVHDGRGHHGSGS